MMVGGIIRARLTIGIYTQESRILEYLGYRIQICDINSQKAPVSLRQIYEQ